MDSRAFCRVFFTFIWIYVFLLYSVCSQKDPSQKLALKSRVFMILRGEDLTIDCDLKKSSNHSTLTCSDPLNNQIYREGFGLATDKTENFKLVLKHLNVSGEYHCTFQKAQVYWFLRVRGLAASSNPFLGIGNKQDSCYDGFKVPAIWDYTDFITVAVFSGVLLIFNVVGSVYVFTGRWIIKCGETEKDEENNRESTERQTENDNVNAVIDPSTSFYASLEPRTRSIYEELQRPAAMNQTEKQRSKPKKRELHQTKQQTTQHQDEAQDESVYENY